MRTTPTMRSALFLGAVMVVTSVLAPATAEAGAKTTASVKAKKKSSTTTTTKNTTAVMVAESGVSMVDCTNRAKEKDLKCSASKSGTVGSGPKFSGGLTTEVRQGFVSGNQLIVAVELSGSDDEYGGVFGVDLTTGKRTLLAGKMNDPALGDVTKGSGPNDKTLNQIRAVTQGPNNTWIAMAARGTTSNRTIFSISPSTGDRTVLFDAASSACTGISGRDIAIDPGSGIAAGPDGAVYVVVNNMPQGSGKGIAKIQGGKCSIVTLTGADTAANNKGSGPTVIGSFLYNVTYRDGSLYLLQYNSHGSILKIDPATGNRTMVTSVDKGNGHDIAQSSMTFAPDGTLWTYAGYANNYSGIVAVDPATGNRTGVEPKGAGPVTRTQGPEKGVWAHPNGKHLIMQYANEILLFDPSTGNSNVLSY